MDYKEALKKIKSEIPKDNQAKAREYLASCKAKGENAASSWYSCLDKYGKTEKPPTNWEQRKAKFDENGNRLSRYTNQPVKRTGAYRLQQIRQEVERVEDAETIQVAEFYNDMDMFATEYIEETFENGKPPKKEDKWIISLNEYLSNRIKKPRRSNPDEIYNCWTAYKKLLHKFGKSAHVLLFSYVCEIDNTAFSRWAGLQSYSVNGSNYGYNLTPRHTQIAKMMIAESYSEHDYKMLLTDNNAILDIFTSKALFGYVETAPVQTINHTTTIKTAAELPSVDDIMSTKNGKLIDVDFQEV